MALFDHTNKSLEELPNLKSAKKLNKLFGTDFMLNKLRSLSGHELGNFRMGAIFLTALFGGMGYYFYRQYKTQKFQVSASYYKLVSLPPLNAGAQFWWNGRTSDEVEQMTYYYRMPLKEYDAKYRNRSAFISGEFDHNKEILIPRVYQGIEGYDVITPFYYYRKLYVNKYLHLHSDGSPFVGNESQRAGIAVYRGWIPASLKDRRTRPFDLNSGNRETLHGTIKRTLLDKHDFVQPNDPSHGLWINHSLEDFAIFWNFPNIRDAMHCYFEEIDFGPLSPEKKDVYPIRPSLQEHIVKDGKERGLKLDRNYRYLATGSTSIAALSAYLIYLAA